MSIESTRADWRRFADDECGATAPMYRAIAHGVADSDEIMTWLAERPAAQRQPNLLLAAVHDRLLGATEVANPTPEPNLATVWAGIHHVDPVSLFLDYWRTHRGGLSQTLETRRTQTNEVGRCAPLALALSKLAAEDPTPIALIDAGCSAGLNLGVDRYRVDFGSAGSLGPPPDRAPLVVESTWHGADDALDLVPFTIGWRAGLDRSPLDLGEDADARWILACVWPEQRERFQRTRAAIAASGSSDVRITGGDLIDDIGPLLIEAPADLRLVVLTSWTLAYLAPSDRARFVQVLAASGRPITWLAMEFPGVVPGVESPSPPSVDAKTPSLITATEFADAGTTTEVLGWTHPHGAWVAPVEA